MCGPFLLLSDVADAELQRIMPAHDGSAPPFHPERAAQAALVRDVYGNPFRPVILGPSFPAPSAMAMVWAIYAGNGFACIHWLAVQLEQRRE